MDAHHQRYSRRGHGQRRAIALVRSGVEQGRFRPDTDPAMVVDMVISPLVYRRVILHEDVSLDYLLTVGDMVLRAIRA